MYYIEIHSFNPTSSLFSENNSFYKPNVKINKHTPYAQYYFSHAPRDIK